MGMRVLICGGRNFNNFDQVKKVMDEIHARTPVETVISGKARGADSLEEKWAIENNIPVDPYPANWNDHGKAAGPIRNQQMLDEGKPDLVVAFPGGNGTLDMIRRANRGNVKVVEAQKEILKELFSQTKGSGMLKKSMDSFVEEQPGKTSTDSGSCVLRILWKEKRIPTQNDETSC